MKKISLILLLATLTGCAGWQNWKPIQEVKGTDGRTYYWLAPMPATADGSPGIAGRSAGVTTYQGTVNGQPFTATVFK